MDLTAIDGRVAIITGGSGLLGVEHARALLAKGAVVVLADINAQQCQEKQEMLAAEYPDATIGTVMMDVTSEASVKQCYEALKTDYGKVDILINNAAVNPAVKDNTVEETSRLEHFPLDQWHHQLDVGLTGAFLCAKYFGHHMAQNGGGVILNIASDLAVFAPDQRLYRDESLPEDRQPVKPVIYSVVKTALLGLTRYLSTYYHEQNVRVNALSPGGVENGQGEAFVQKLTNLIPLGRMADRDEYHGAVQFLCSDASKYMTGQNIVIDGGRSVW